MPEEKSELADCLSTYHSSPLASKLSDDKCVVHKADEQRQRENHRNSSNGH